MIAAAHIEAANQRPNLEHFPVDAACTVDRAFAALYAGDVPFSDQTLQPDFHRLQRLDELD